MDVVGGGRRSETCTYSVYTDATKGEGGPQPGCTTREVGLNPLQFSPLRRRVSG